MGKPIFAYITPTDKKVAWSVSVLGWSALSVRWCFLLAWLGSVSGGGGASVPPLVVLGGFALWGFLGRFFGVFIL